MIPLTAKFLDSLHVLQGLCRGLQPLVLGLHNGAVVLGHGFAHLISFVKNDDDDGDITMNWAGMVRHVPRRHPRVALTPR